MTGSRTRSGQGHLTPVSFVRIGLDYNWDGSGVGRIAREQVESGGDSGGDSGVGIESAVAYG